MFSRIVGILRIGLERDFCRAEGTSIRAKSEINHYYYWKTCTPFDVKPGAAKYEFQVRRRL